MLRRGITFMSAICVIATAGYVLAGWSWIDAIYMVVITIFGVGYGEVQPIESPLLKLFTTGFILAGCTSLIYVIGGLIHMLTEGEIEKMLGNRQRFREIENLSDHTIICGYGRVGQMLAAELREHDGVAVVLDNNPTRVEQAHADGFLAIEGNAVDDDTLLGVGIYRAKTLATVLPDDAVNVFITLTARDLCDSIRIIARAENPATERKLLRGGATNVVMPAAIGAVRIAQLATADELSEESLPEARYRMLNRTKASEVRINPIREGNLQAVHEEIEELAVMASDLTCKMQTPGVVDNSVALRSKT